MQKNRSSATLFKYQQVCMLAYPTDQNDQSRSDAWEETWFQPTLILIFQNCATQKTELHKKQVPYCTYKTSVLDPDPSINKQKK